MRERPDDVRRLFIDSLSLGSGMELFDELAFPRTPRLSRADTTPQGNVALPYEVEHS